MADLHAFSPIAFEDAFDIGLDLILATPLAWVVDVANSASFAADGGVEPYTYALSGDVPRCLSISAAGLLSGTLYVVGTFTFTITVTDAAGTTASEVVVLTGSS